MQLDRTLSSHHPLAPGETVHIQLQLTNNEQKAVDYTIIEELAPGLQLVDTDGQCNRHAGFVVWRGPFAAGATVTVHYTMQSVADARCSPTIPLYA